MGKFEEGRQLGLPSKDNIKMDLQEVGWGHGLERSSSGQGQVMGCCECGNELSGSINCRDFVD